jgi:hypothetical protein
MTEPNQSPYYLVTSIFPPGLVRRFGSEAEALTYASVTATKNRLRLLIVRVDPVEPEVLCSIVAECSGELPF